MIDKLLFIKNIFNRKGNLYYRLNLYGNNGTGETVTVETELLDNDGSFLLDNDGTQLIDNM